MAVVWLKPGASEKRAALPTIRRSTRKKWLVRADSAARRSLALEKWRQELRNRLE
ncbi:MAG: hypothetical protein H7Z75_02015 [Ferruginibacter sp.]|nr:hypothetical protein [Cytophagales bacterium]